MAKDNQFRTPSKDEIELRANREKDRQKALKEAEALANKCINSKDFVKYRDKYVALERVTIDALIDFNDPDPIRYAFGMRRMADELRQLKLLLHDVNVDNRPKPKDKK